MKPTAETDPIAVQRVAEVLISVEGASAPQVARQKAVEALDQGDIEAFSGWHRIYRAARASLQSI
jgi:hypothetical protein